MEEGLKYDWAPTVENRERWLEETNDVGPLSTTRDATYWRNVAHVALKAWRGMDAAISALATACRRATVDWDEANHELGQASADQEILDALETLTPSILALKHPKGGDMSEWPKDLRIQEEPKWKEGRKDKA